ncbi:MAG: enoyl-CoA hydratase-related protein [Candidatus Acidiferrales bacterium]|jgi:methylglutaconyl-CoA hydratase
MSKSETSVAASYDALKYEKDGAIATITLNRPDKRNAISGTMIDELLGALNSADTDGAVRVLILTGAGRAFCSGMDLETLQSIAKQTPEQNLADSRQMARMFHRIYSFPKPLITAVNGAAVAGGCGIATFSDITLAVPEAKFGYTEVRIGFIPALVSVLLRRQIGEKHARELLLTGATIDAAEAFRLGMVTEIVPAENLLKRAHEVAARFLEASPTSLRRTKRLLLQYNEREVTQEIEMATQENAAIRATEDFREGLASFLEKRQPKWTGQ